MTTVAGPIGPAIITGEGGSGGGGSSLWSDNPANSSMSPIPEGRSLILAPEVGIHFGDPATQCPCVEATSTDLILEAQASVEVELAGVERAAFGLEGLTLAGTVTVGPVGANPAPGAIQYVDEHFWGFNGVAWNSLDEPPDRQPTASGNWQWFYPITALAQIAPGVVGCQRTPDDPAGNTLYFNVLDQGGNDQTSNFDFLQRGDKIIGHVGVLGRLVYTVNEVRVQAGGTIRELRMQGPPTVSGPVPETDTIETFDLRYPFLQGIWVPITDGRARLIEPYTGILMHGSSPSLGFFYDPGNATAWVEVIGTGGESDTPLAFNVGSNPNFNSLSLLKDGTVAIGGVPGYYEIGYETLEVNGGVRIGTARPGITTRDGTLQFAGGKFQGYANGAWADLGGGPSSGWIKDAGWGFVYLEDFALNLCLATTTEIFFDSSGSQRIGFDGTGNFHVSNGPILGNGMVQFGLYTGGFPAAGMVQWSGTKLQVHDGTDWIDLH